MNKKERQYRLKIPSQTENLELIRLFVSSLAGKMGFNEEDVNKIELAVDEACTNVIEHAYHHDDSKDIDIAITLGLGKLIVVVSDSGNAFNDAHFKLPNMKDYLAELRVGGLGIYLMKTLMDEVDYHTTPGKINEVRMVKYFMKKRNRKKAEVS